MKHLLVVASACLSIVHPATASAETTQTLGDEQTLFVYCTWSTGAAEKSMSQIEEIKWRDTINNYDNGKKFISQHRGSYVTQLESKMIGKLGTNTANCEWSTEREYKYFSPNSSYTAISGQTIRTVLKPLDPSWFVVDDLRQNLAVVTLGKRKLTKTGSAEPAKSSTPAKDVAEKPEAPKGPTAAELAAEKHRAVEERNRLAREAYEAKLAEQKRKVEAFERAQEEVARKKAAQAVAAAEVLSDYEAKRAASDELLRRHDAEQRRHNACIQGDQQACADIAAGKPVDAKLADAGKASTDTDANRCVTSPELRENDTFKGNTAAYVVNGCAKPVDVRTCLKRASGQWNCGMKNGLAPQARWSHSSFEATGEVFVDARTSGSGRPLAMPN